MITGRCEQCGREYRRAGRGHADRPQRLCSHACRRAAQIRPLGEYVIADPETQCWVWLGYRDRKGYAWVTRGGRPQKAARYFYELLSGKIPAGLTTDHVCRNTSCVNPMHLELVTRGENTRRAHVLPACGKCGGPWRVFANGKRDCPTCNAAWQRARYARRS